MGPFSLNHQTTQVLEWPVLLEYLAQEAASSLGKTQCRSLKPALDLPSAQFQQKETEEMMNMMEGPNPPQPIAFPDIENMLVRASKEGILTGADLRDISLVLGLGQQVRQLLLFHRETYPALFTRFSDFHDVGHLKQTIDYCVDLNGDIHDSASPELQQLSDKCQDLRRRIRRKLEHMLGSPQYEDLLQGQYFAEREHRYVLPIKAERQHEVEGIVHDISSTGATVFIEPQPLIELNNAIKFADLQRTQEVKRILLDLSHVVTESVLQIQETTVALAELDCLAAKARLSVKLGGSSIPLNEVQRISLKDARHPLLVLTKTHVVANSIRLDGARKVLLISGPNAGGKTVSLKLTGLIALMVKVGLLPPCAPNSEMAFFHHIYADIGDTQDLSRDVSSFSGHILHIIEILEQVAHHQVNGTQTLVLLDEVGSSTDPIEGAALAEALLQRLSDLGCSILATTHYPSLKTLALRNPLVRNASQEFDMATLSPTYRLLDGIPGGSSALEIARRLGLEELIIEQSKGLITRQDYDLEQIFRTLQNTQSQLAQETSAARQLRKDAQGLFQEAKEARDRSIQQQQEDRLRYRKQWQRQFSKSQRELNQILEEVKKEKSLSNVKGARQRLREVQEHIDQNIQPLVDSVSLPPKKGDLVEFDSLGTTGELLEDPGGQKLVSIRVGSQTVRTNPESLRTVSFHKRAKSASPSRDQISSRRLSSHEFIASEEATKVTRQGYQKDIDLRGSRPEEALEATIDALDQAIVHETKYLRVIHGVGTGVLRATVRKYCQTSPYLKSFRAGEPSEGGEGVTIMELR